MSWDGPLSKYRKLHLQNIADNNDKVNLHIFHPDKRGNNPKFPSKMRPKPVQWSLDWSKSPQTAFLSISGRVIIFPGEFLDRHSLKCILWWCIASKGILLRYLTFRNRRWSFMQFHVKFELFLRLQLGKPAVNMKPHKWTTHHDLRKWYN